MQCQSQSNVQSQCDSYFLGSLDRVLLFWASLLMIMASNCKFLQISQSICESQVPTNILQSLDRALHNSLNDPSTSRDLSIRQGDVQVLNWTPNTEGTVSLILYWVPTKSMLVKLQPIVCPFFPSCFHSICAVLPPSCNGLTVAIVQSIG